MTDTAAVITSRDPLERLTDERLTRPLRTPSPAIRAMIQRATRDKPDEFWKRIEASRRSRERV